MFGLKSRFEFLPDEMLRQAKQLSSRTGLPIRLAPHRKSNRDPRKRRRMRWSRPSNIAGAVVVGTLTKTTAAATTTDTVSGMPGQPKAVIFCCNRRQSAGFSNTVDCSISIGFSDGTNNHMVECRTEDNQTTVNKQSGGSRDDSKCIRMRDASIGTILFNASCAMNSDGFTLTYNNNNAETTQIAYIAIIAGTADIKAKVLAKNSPTVTGNNAQTGAGFAPKLCFFLMNGHQSSTGSGQVSASNPGGISFGAFDGTNQWCSFGAIDGVTSSNSRAGQRTDEVIRACDTSSTTTRWVAAGVSLDSDGFTLNWTTVDTGSQKYGILCLGGADLNVKVSATTVPTSTGSFSKTGVGFKPDGLLCATWDRVASTSLQGNFHQMVGLSDGSNHACVTSFETSGSSASTCGVNYSTSQIIATLPSTPTATHLECSLTSFDSDGFTMNEGTASGTAIQFLYVALGVPSGPSGSAVKAAMYQYRHRRN